MARDAGAAPAPAAAHEVSGPCGGDYREYGDEFGTAPPRLRELDAALPVIRDRLARLNPPPVRNPPPIMIGGGGEKVTLRIVAQHADIWNGFDDPDRAAHECRVLDEWCRRAARNPATIERSVAGLGPSALPELDRYLAAGVTHRIMGTSGPRLGSQPAAEAG